ncbi:MAG TPA: redox-regulated ATPase YchF [bacterium]|nr:redox-regulated ATPase YchF [bacterium]
MKLGIVGLPNVGKSTLFNAITKAGAAAANFPFCTIEPNVGAVAVPDARLDQLAQWFDSKKTVPAGVEFVDIAGLVKGASQGEGLGNKFLSHIRETQAIVHVVRCFEDKDITHVSGKVDPASDIEIVETELILADLESVEKQFERLAKKAKGGDKEAAHQQELAHRLKEHLGKGLPARTAGLSADDMALVKDFFLISSKPVLYAMNVAESDLPAMDNAFTKAVQAVAAAEGAMAIPICAKIESEIGELPEDEAQAFLKDLGLSEPGLHRLIHAGYDLLGLQSFYTAGPQEARAWTIKKGTRAPQAASEIHSDIERGFIRAEIMGYQDLLAKNGDEKAIKDSGLLRQEGKEYVMADGDIVHFKFNV